MRKRKKALIGAKMRERVRRLGRATVEERLARKLAAQLLSGLEKSEKLLKELERLERVRNH